MPLESLDPSPAQDERVERLFVQLHTARAANDWDTVAALATELSTKFCTSLHDLQKNTLTGIFTELENRRTRTVQSVIVQIKPELLRKIY